MTFIARHLTTRISQHGYDFSLQGGEILFISGESGSGKSLLLRALADLDEHGGDVILNDQNQQDWAADEWRRQVAYCPAESAWWAQRVGDHFVKKPSSEILSRLGFDESVLQWQTDRLSSGEKQRLGLCRVLCMRPAVVLLDEPTANLDEENVHSVEQVLRSYLDDHDAIFVWVSHSRAQQARFDARVLAL